MYLYLPSHVWNATLLLLSFKRVTAQAVCAAVVDLSTPLPTKNGSSTTVTNVLCLVLILQLVLSTEGVGVGDGVGTGVQVVQGAQVGQGVGVGQGVEVGTGVAVGQACTVALTAFPINGSSQNGCLDSQR